MRNGSPLEPRTDVEPCLADVRPAEWRHFLAVGEVLAQQASIGALGALAATLPDTRVASGYASCSHM